MSENNVGEIAGEQPVVITSNDVAESGQESKNHNDILSESESAECNSSQVDEAAKTQTTEEAPVPELDSKIAVDPIDNVEETIKISEFVVDMKDVENNEASAPPVELSDVPTSEEKLEPKIETIENHNNVVESHKEDENVSSKENVDKTNAPNDDVIFIKPKDKERNHCYW